MTDSELDAIEKRANAATPGPWSIRVCFDEQRGPVDPETYESPGYYDNLGVYSESADEWPAACGEYAIFHSPADARLIANARADVPALVAEVRRKNVALARIAAELHRRHLGSWWQCEGEMCERLRAALGDRLPGGLAP